MIAQREIISQDLSGKDRLKKALEEINTLTNKLQEQRTEFDDKVYLRTRVILNHTLEC